MSAVADTIAAISTPIGEGGIGIVRLSGDRSFQVAKKIFKPRSKRDIDKFENRKLYLGNIVDPETHEVIDEVLIVFFKAPHTYTREDMVEINCHGGLMAQKKILDLTLRDEVRIADPGEFTKRAFLNGRIDLSQAEAVIDVIRAKTERALVMANRQLAGGLSDRVQDIRKNLLSIIVHIEANIDFPEEDIPEADLSHIKQEIEDTRVVLDRLIQNSGAGKIMRDGISTLILGNTNVGKSSLLNALLKEERAIVTDIPGTTRDVIEEYVDIKGIPIKIIDTAGIRRTQDKVESIGIRRAMDYLDEAQMILFTVDASRNMTDDDLYLIDKVKDKFTIVVLNKVDLPLKFEQKTIEELLPGKKIVKVSALKEEGIDELKQAIYDAVEQEIGFLDEHAIIAGERQRQVMQKAKESLDLAIESMANQMPVEVVELDIRQAWEKLGEITGDTVSDNIITAIFENFCIGK